MEWKTDHVRKNIGQLNAIIERKEMNVKFEFDAGPNLGQKWINFGQKRFLMFAITGGLDLIRLSMSKLQ